MQRCKAEALGPSAGLLAGGSAGLTSIWTGLKLHRPRRQARPGPQRDEPRQSRRSAALQARPARLCVPGGQPCKGLAAGLAAGAVACTPGGAQPLLAAAAQLLPVVYFAVHAPLLGAPPAA